MKKENFPSFPAFAKMAAAPVAAPKYLSGVNTFVDMFCGIGAFHLAAASFGMKCVYACDIDDECRKVYKHNYGITPAGDITMVKADSIPDHDLFCAGFPCQPFSILGHRKGFGDIRGTLFFEIARILETKRPRVVLLENVKQLVTHDKGGTLKKIIESLRSLDYHVSYKVLNALHCGLPQRRERVIIAATLDAFKDEDFLWPTAKQDMTPLVDILEKKPDPKHLTSERIRKRRQQAHKSKHKPGIWHENKAGNVSSYPYSCALRAGASYNYLLVDGKRRLTAREMLRLQGFPDTFEIISSDGQVRKQAGNAVAVPLIMAGLKGVLDVVKKAKVAGKRASA